MKLRAHIVAACGLSLLAPGIFAADLLDVYQRALQNDPIIREADANRLASRESKPQALASLLPQLEASGGYTKDKEEFSRIQPQRVSPDAPDVIFVPVTTDSDSDGYQWAIQLRQTVFRWDQWAALKRADAQVAQAEADYQAAQQELIQRTAQRYFDVLAAQDTVDAAQATLDAFSRQLEQAEKRFEVGADCDH
jgi:Outer membrane protein